MLDGEDFKEIVAGRRRGWGASLCRMAFRLAEIPYAGAVRWRNLRYDHPHSVQRVTVPVISVGNLTVGGTGKTPMVCWLARWFRQQDYRVAIISRGYGAEAGARNDEALDLEQSLPDVPHLQNPDRLAAAETAIEEFQSQLILLDDAFQHRRIYRDLDIVLIDALAPFGYGHMLPRGLLREPVASLRRADLIVLSKADLVSDAVQERIRAEIRSVAGTAPVITARHRPLNWSTSSGILEPLARWDGKPVAAFCGIGNPEGFAKTLDQCGVQRTDLRVFPDHHAYDREDLESLIEWASTSGAVAAVCTTKDLVKLQLDRLGTMPLRALQIGIDFGRDKDVLEQRLKRVVR